jgi:hypothetical protein
MAEVKRAYRRLAKAYHPDSAGEQALPRFLAIHEAYESIRTGRPMPAVRRGNGPAANRPASEPWRADPDRARAAREQARKRAGARPAGSSAGNANPGPGSAAGSTSGPRRGSARSGSAGARASSPSGASGRGGSGGATGTTGGTGRRRNTRKATMGSTSYDEARDPNDATWSGASWYGPSSGEYWIINPREYADPRKHGPEYQSRARRMAAAGAATESFEADGEEATQPAPATEESAPRRAESWSFGTGASAGGTAATRHERAGPRNGRAAARPREAWAGSVAEDGSDVTDAGTARAPSWPAGARPSRRGPRFGGRPMSARDLIAASSDDPVRRFGIALIAWPPVGLAAAGVIGDLTGCATYSASCGGTEPLLPWLAQAVILGLLLLLPPLARVLAGGAIAILAALVPLTFLLVAIGGTGAAQSGFALSFFLAIAWLAGVAWALAEVRRRARTAATAIPGARA